MLTAQAAVGSLISLLFIVEPTVSSMFWLLSAMLVQLYLLMYVMLFAAALKLRRSRPEVERPFRVPGGRPGIWLVCGTGILFSLAAFMVGFVPPSGLPESSVLSHNSAPVGAVAFGLLAPPAVSRWSRGQRLSPMSAPTRTAQIEPPLVRAERAPVTRRPGGTVKALGTRAFFVFSMMPVYVAWRDEARSCVRFGCGCDVRLPARGCGIVLGCG